MRLGVPVAALGVLFVWGLSACTQPDLQPPPSGPPAMAVRYPTNVLSYSPSGGVGTVDAAAVTLGAPDGQAAPLGVNGQLLVLFATTPVTNGPGDDLKIYGTFMADTQVLVEASENGVDYHYSGYVTARQPNVDLDNATLGYASYIRLTDSGRGGAAIDSLQILQVNGQ